MSAPITIMLIWNEIKIMVTHTPNRFGETDHIELHAEHRQRLPITETGYRSHFCHESQIEPHGSALAYVQAWLDHEATKPEWRAYEFASRQMSLL
ncbi:hypothetical protein DBR17_16655 [Sphingomonas sp. HMWF008]|nr:hypothetical protein DBR17_16655 [Sphingomonas sp. HMWF008]